MSEWGCDVRLVFYSENHVNSLALYLQSDGVFYFENDGVPTVFCTENVRRMSCFENVLVVFCSGNDDKVFCSENDDGVFCSINVDEGFCFEKGCDAVEFFLTSCVCSCAFEELRHFSLNHRTS